jgi:hypothetical protein
MPMSAHTITLKLPPSLYDYFAGRAQRTRRSLEAEVLDAVAAATPVAEPLPAELEDAAARLETMGDDELWQTARDRLTRTESQRLEELNLRQQEKGLGDAEREELAELLRRYETAILLRAEAARLLAARGHDISRLLIDPAAE